MSKAKTVSVVVFQGPKGVLDVGVYTTPKLAEAAIELWMFEVVKGNHGHVATIKEWGVGSPDNPFVPEYWRVLTGHFFTYKEVPLQ